MENRYQTALKESYENYSSGKLIDISSDFGHSSLLRKFYEIWNPSLIINSEKSAAIEVLEKRGIDYKLRQDSRKEARKRLNLKKFDKFKRDFSDPFISLKNNIRDVYVYGKIETN